MATCQTERWVSTSPYVKLTVTLDTNNANSVMLAYRLEYISDSAANTSASKSYTINIGSEKITGTYDINKKTGTNLIRSGSVYVAKTKATQKITCSCSFAFGLTWSSVYCGTKTATTTINIAAKDKYAITYSANGGSGAPATQYKWYGEPIVLASTKPTKAGHTFKGWKASNGYTYQPGTSFEVNAATTMTAIWEANTYTVTYNANGGTGAPAAQTKTYGVNLTLTTSKPTRTNYTFKGWATSSTGAVSYQAGGTYTANAAITLYAVWESSYVLPKIFDVSVYWTNHTPQMDENGVESRHIGTGFHWETTHANPNISFSIYDSNGNLKNSFSWRATGNSDNGMLETKQWTDYLFRTDMSYTIKITIEDSGGSTTVTATLAGNIYPIDVLVGGKGISFGGPASLEDTAHFQWVARFDKPVHGMVRGLGKLPKIEAGSDFNDYMDFGAWAVYGNADSLEINNMPPLYSNSGVMVGRAGILEVFSPTGEGMRSAEWSYIRQRFIPYSLSYPIMERDITRNASNVWSYGAWYKTSLSTKDNPVTLFSGNSSGTITLSQAASNFEYLEIFFTDNNGEKGGYTKLHYPYTSVIDLFIIEAAGVNTYIRRTSYSISGTTMTPDTTNAGYALLDKASLNTITGTSYIKITRVVGRNS